MSDLRKAAQDVLNALNAPNRHTLLGISKQLDAIDALRAALATPEAEPVAHQSRWKTYDGEWSEWIPGKLREHPPGIEVEIRALYDHPPAAQAEIDRLNAGWHEANKAALSKALALNLAREALKKLSFAAQTTGGVAGRDEGLCQAIEGAAEALAAIDAALKGGKS